MAVAGVRGQHATPAGADMRVGSLFTGYGGLDLATGGELAWYAEIEPAACKVLAHHYPGVPNLGDITKIDWTTVPPVDVITGGYPCQPFSGAGHRKGADDERHLWPFVRDAIRTLGPRYAILENVRGHLTLGFADVLADLANIGFDAEWTVVGAADIGAPHRRERLFILAYPESEGSQGSKFSSSIIEGRLGWGVATAESHSNDAYSINQGSQRPIVATENVGSASATPQPAPSSNSDLVPDTNSERYGSRQRPAEMAGMDRADASETRQRERSRSESGTRGGVDWGRYEPAIRQWENILGRLAPDPTIMGTSDRHRLNPVFVEWMMGLPEGWVTGHGLSPAQCLKMLGNGVVPQQAHHAITHLLERTS